MFKSFSFFRCCLFLLPIAFFSYCTSPKDKIDSGILSKQQMINILLDISIIDATNSLNLGYVNTNKDSIYFYDVFKKNNVSKDDYEKSILYYKSNSRLFNEVYDSVLVRLENLKKLP